MTSKKLLKCSASLTIYRKPKSISILSTLVQYAISNSATNPPTSGWKNNIVAATTQYPYLWTRTIVIYSDGTSTISYSVSQKGEPGPAGTSVKILGQLSSVSDLNKIKTPAVGDGYIINGDLWTYTGSTTNNYGFINSGKIQGPAGNDALTFVVSPGTILIDADEDGTLSSKNNYEDGLGEEYNCDILVFKNGNDITRNCKYEISSTENFTLYRSSDNFYFASVINGTVNVYTNGINLRSYTLADNTKIYAACTNAWIKVNVTYENISYPVTISIAVQMSASMCKIMHDNTTLLSEYTEIKNNYVTKSSFNQTASDIALAVAKQGNVISDLSTKNKTQESEISSLKIKADTIESTVKKTTKGDNILGGQNGVGWSNNIEYQVAGPTYKFNKASEWYYAPAFQDYSGNCILSFFKYGDCAVKVQVWAFDQTYDNNTNYDINIDKKDYSPDMTILETNYSYTTSEITTYSSSNYSGTWAVTSVENINTGDKAALKVYDNTAKIYKYIYVNVTSVDQQANTITAKSLDLLVPATLVADVSTGYIVNNTEVAKMHFSDFLQRYWVKFTENAKSNKTFLIRFQPTTDDGASLQKIMVEDDVDEPHKYMNGFATTQSMIKQTANEIIQQVGDTYVKIGDGNITLNGNTKVKGSLVLDSDDQGFVLNGKDGKTEISPKSIGTAAEFKNKTSHIIRTNISDSTQYGAQQYNSNQYDFNWSSIQNLGTLPKGSYISFKNFSHQCYDLKGNYAGIPYSTLHVYENNVFKKAFPVNASYTKDVGSYTVTADSEVSIVVTSYKSEYISNSETLSPQKSIVPNKKIDDRLPLLQLPTLSLSISWDNEIPITNGYMLIGYDGIAVNFGTNKSVYIGKEGLIANYGAHEIKITSDGIYKRNGRNTHTIIGAGTINSPIRYTIEEPVDTVLCLAANSMVIFPANPYEGQVIKIFDKSSENCYINSNGKYVVSTNSYGTGSVWTKTEMDGRRPWQYTFINGKWYEEYIG